jgi:hypothetical protein
LDISRRKSNLLFISQTFQEFQLVKAPELSFKEGRRKSPQPLDETSFNKSIRTVITTKAIFPYRNIPDRKDAANNAIFCASQTFQGIK